MASVTAPLSLSSTVDRAFRRLAADLQRVFGPRFVALVAYGTNHSAAFAGTIAAADLDALSALAGVWRHDGLAAPLLMTPDEFRRSLHAFPIEYQAILDRHVVIAGEPPFDGVAIRPDDLRRACEAQARSLLIHLRQGWMHSAGHQEHLVELVERSTAPFRALLANVARLTGIDDRGDESLARFAEQSIGMPADLVRAILDVDARPEEARQLVSRLPAYLAAAETFWTFVDVWRSK
jgi:hypothetical protein